MSGPAVAPTKAGTLLDAALAYHADGYNVIPVGEDKKPLDLMKWGHWQTHRQTEAEVRDFPWHRTFGIALGLTWPTSNLVVLDFDGPHAEKEFHWIARAIKDAAKYLCRNRKAEGFSCEAHCSQVSIETARALKDLDDGSAMAGFQYSPSEDFATWGSDLHDLVIGDVVGVVYD